MATQTEVARHLSLTDRQLRRLQKLPGAPISNKRGQLDLDAWRDFYISYLRRSKNDVPDGDSEDDYEEKLLIARWELTAEQAVTQQLKNEVSKGKLIDTGFCIFALSKLAMALSSTLDSIPLSMQRQFPDLTPRHLDHLKTLLLRGQISVRGQGINYRIYSMNISEQQLNNMMAAVSVALQPLVRVVPMTAVEWLIKIIICLKNLHMVRENGKRCHSRSHYELYG